MESQQQYIDGVKSAYERTLGIMGGYAQREIELSDTSLKQIALELIRLKVAEKHIEPLVWELTEKCLHEKFPNRSKLHHDMGQAYRLTCLLEKGYNYEYFRQYYSHVADALHRNQHLLKDRNMDDVLFGVRYALEQQHIKSFRYCLSQSITAIQPKQKRQVDLDMDNYAMAVLGIFTEYVDSVLNLKFSEKSSLVTIAYIFARASGFPCNQRYLSTRFKQKQKQIIKASITSLLMENIDGDQDDPIS